MSESAVSEFSSMDVSSARREPPWTGDQSRILDAFGTAREGLDPEEAKRRLEAVGLNRLRTIERRSVAAILWDQFKSLVVLLLVAAMGVSFIFGQTVEALAIAAVLALNTTIGFFPSGGPSAH